MSHLKNTFTSVGISKWVSWTGFKFYETGHSKFELANLLSTTGILVTQLSHSVQEGFENKHWKQLNSAFSVSTKGHYFGFMFMTSDLTSHVHGDVNPSSSHLSWLSVWEWPLGLYLVSSSILLSGQFPIEIQMTSISVIILWLFIVLSILLDNSTNYSSDLGKNRWPFPTTSPVRPYRGSSSLESKKTLTCSFLPNNTTSILNGEWKKFWIPVSGSHPGLNSPVIWGSRSHKVFFICKWKLVLSYISVLTLTLKFHTYFPNQNVDIKPNQLPSTLCIGECSPELGKQQPAMQNIGNHQQ